MSSNSHLVVNIAEARSIVAGTKANPSDQPYTAGGTTETTNESRHGQPINLVFVVRMVETGRFFDPSGFLTYLGIVLVFSAAALVVSILFADPSPLGVPVKLFACLVGRNGIHVVHLGWYVVQIVIKTTNLKSSSALRGMLANGMVIAIFAVVQSIVDIPF
ncbi:hypothetical protein JVT61DRAFT_6009 [Boletus reticuloceps]|uniref:Uncharacterized protein n=1 Tax=Boletus reticuloceps TaxID=495285 RepID=A0A8I2YLB8_9AGAM|nr:hypothetical protein JVT61DRAFT_6009 [Boletus reticuloceps]